jgi:hypothetical protein
VTLRAALVAAGLTLSCASATEGPLFATSESFVDSPRKPPSFSAERTLATSEAAGPGETPAIQRAVLPLDSEAARELVGRFFIAVLDESSRDLLPLLATSAVVVSEGNRQPAQAAWRARFAQLDYTSLSGRVVAAPQTLRTYTYASAGRAKRDGVPAPESPNEVVVVARPGLSWAGKTRLFGEELAFRLRPRPGEARYEIAEIVEDFRLP